MADKMMKSLDFGTGDKYYPTPSAVMAVTTEGTGAAYTVTIPGITELVAGLVIFINPHTNVTTASATIDVNGLGAKQIKRRYSYGTTTTIAIQANLMTKGHPVKLTYNGTYWYVSDYPKPYASDLSGVLSISYGGTGSNSAAKALANLGGASTNDLLARTSFMDLSDSTTEVLDGLTDNMDYVQKYIYYAQVNPDLKLQNTPITEDKDFILYVGASLGFAEGHHDQTLIYIEDGKAYHRSAINAGENWSEWTPMSGGSLDGTILKPKELKNVNIDTFVEPGYYCAETGSGCTTNDPVVLGSVGDVLQAESFSLQIIKTRVAADGTYRYIQILTLPGLPGRIFIRNMSNIGPETNFRAIIDSENISNYAATKDYVDNLMLVDESKVV